MKQQEVTFQLHHYEKGLVLTLDTFECMSVGELQHITTQWELIIIKCWHEHIRLGVTETGSWASYEQVDIATTFPNREEEEVVLYYSEKQGEHMAQ